MIRHLHVTTDGYRIDTPGQDYTPTKSRIAVAQPLTSNPPREREGRRKLTDRWALSPQTSGGPRGIHPGLPVSLPPNAERGALGVSSHFRMGF